MTLWWGVLTLNRTFSLPKTYSLVLLGYSTLPYSEITPRIPFLLIELTTNFEHSTMFINPTMHSWAQLSHYAPKMILGLGIGVLTIPYLVSIHFDPLGWILLWIFHRVLTFQVLGLVVLLAQLGLLKLVFLE